jgi:hypothetical protein
MSESTSSRFETYIAVCIALATVIGAVLAARATLLNDDANTADQVGLASTIDLALTRSSTEAQRAQNLTAFLDYSQRRASALRMSQQMEQIDPASDRWAALDEASSAEWNRAINSRYFFNTDYYDKFTNTWDQQAFMDGQLTEAASLQDLNPAPHFADAESGRDKAARFVGVIAALSLALFSLAVANVIRSRLRFGLAALGTLILIGAGLVSILIEANVL